MQNWASLFDCCEREPPAPASVLERSRELLSARLSDAELEAVRSLLGNPFPAGDPLHSKYHMPDPRDWRLPDVPLPPRYLELLGWSNGLGAKWGDREFAFFSLHDVRRFALDYLFPEYMPEAIPIGLDGGGVFAAFDTRGGPAAEYPIVLIGSGALDWDDAVVVADSIDTFCRERTALADIYSPDPEDSYADIVELVVMAPPQLETLARLRTAFVPQVSLGELKASVQDLPYVLVSGVTRIWLERKEHHKPLPEWLVVRVCDPSA